MTTKCPVCLAPTDQVCDIPIRDFDGSIFNLTSKVVACPACGLCRVDTGLSDEAIGEHYAHASMYSALSGVGVGGNTPEDLVRYRHYEQFMSRAGCLRGSLADIGCSRGGFLRYLAGQRPELSLAGVDCDLGSLKQLAEAGLTALPGDVAALPLEDESRDALSYFHVLEHVYDVDRVLRDAFRVLKPGGTLLLEVPDAEAYGVPECHVGAMFWAGMKEHVNHFSPTSLTRLCERNGFGVTGVTRSYQPMKSGQAYPSLMLSAAKDRPSTAGGHAVTNRIRDYFLGELDAVRMLADRVVQATVGEGPVTLWGMGLEFFAIYPHLAARLKGRRLQLLDSNPSKVGQRVDGITVVHPDAAARDGWLVSCSYMANREIVGAAIRSGWPEDRIVDIARLGLAPAGSRHGVGAVELPNMLP